MEEIEDTGDEENTEVDFPSDLTIDHHLQRTADYSLFLEDFPEEIGKRDSDSDWIIGNVNISNKCKSLKENTLVLNKYPASLSDIRLL